MAKRTYSQEEVDAIFSRAIDQQAKDQSSLSHEDLVNAASEVGISRDAIEAAERELGDAGKDKTDRELLRSFKRRQRVAFARHLVVYVLVNLLLAFVNIATSTAFLWFLIVTLGWGIGMAMHFMSVAFPDDEKIVERERRRHERRARRDRWKTRGAEFERAVSEGVKLILEASHKQTARIAADEPKKRVDEREPLEEDEEESRDARDAKAR